MPIGIQIKMDIEEAREMLDNMMEFSYNPIPAHREIAAYLVHRQPVHFKTKRGPDGTPWPPLHPFTVAEKLEAGYSIEPLIRTGMLLSSFSSWVTRDQIAVGTPLEYAAPQHFGTGRYGFMLIQMGQATLTDVGRISTKHPSPTKHAVPPRPFLYVNESEQEEVLQIYKKHMEKARKGERPMGGWQ